jgi:hypothetical protein
MEVNIVKMKELDIPEELAMGVNLEPLSEGYRSASSQLISTS